MAATSASARPSAPPQPIDVPVETDALDAALRELIGIYERLHELAVRRRDAIAKAEARSLGAMIGEENALVQRIAEIEKRRMVAASRLGEALGLPDRSQATVRAIAERLGGEGGARLARGAARLREVATGVQRLNEIVRTAAETLSQHVEGLVRAVQNELSSTKTYEARGRMASRRSAPAALDLCH